MARTLGEWLIHGFGMVFRYGLGMVVAWFRYGLGMVLAWFWYGVGMV